MDTIKRHHVLFTERQGSYVLHKNEYDDGAGLLESSLDVIQKLHP